VAFLDPRGIALTRPDVPLLADFINLLESFQRENANAVVKPLFDPLREPLRDPFRDPLRERDLERVHDRE
jgi:hypothetical protein